ncbi:MAG: hypothetical protein EA367_15910 [Leptolyngbya sp. DLM2.Bin15]|nr:MAG: hypothetical protein EA367_15910 [Leptolyngbya sp. DLM2.Bin15]
MKWAIQQVAFTKLDQIVSRGKTTVKQSRLFMSGFKNMRIISGFSHYKRVVAGLRAKKRAEIFAPHLQATCTDRRWEALPGQDASVLIDRQNSCDLDPLVGWISVSVTQRNLSWYWV